MKDWDNDKYKDKELAQRKANGLCTMCPTKIELDYINNEWVETCLHQPLEASKKYMFMNLCDEHYEEVRRSVSIIHDDPECSVCNSD